MPDASSPFLNQPLRSEEQARKDRLNREITEREIARRLGHHGSDHLRDILDHAANVEFIDFSKKRVPEAGEVS